MNTIDFPIERINKYLDNHIFEVYLQPTHDEDYSVPTNVKVKLTGVKDYITMGDKRPHVQYTITILPTNKESDAWNKAWGGMYGKELPINTSSNQYSELRWIVNEKLSDFLQYFGVDKKAICTKIINELAEFPTMYPYGKVEFKMSMFLTDFVIRYQPILYSTTNMNTPPSVDTLKEAMEKVESFIEQYYEWERKVETDFQNQI